MVWLHSLASKWKADLLVFGRRLFVQKTKESEEKKGNISVAGLCPIMDLLKKKKSPSGVFQRINTGDLLMC